MDVVAFPKSVPEADANGGSHLAVVKGSDVVRRYGEGRQLPLRLAGATPDKAWLAELIEKVGLGDRLSHRPSELSVERARRVALRVT